MNQSQARFTGKFFATQAKVIAALPSSNPAIMAKVLIKRTAVTRHLAYLKERQLIYISAWQRSPSGGSYYPVFALGCLPDMTHQKKVAVKKILSADEVQKKEAAKIIAKQRKVEMQSFSRGADYRNWPVMAAFYGVAA